MIIDTTPPNVILGDPNPDVEAEGLTEEELKLIRRLTLKLSRVQAHNTKKQKYYEGKIPIQQLNISNRAELQALKVGVAFPSIVVDTINERINLEGFLSDESIKAEIDEVFSGNYLKNEFSMGNKDSLIVGQNYISLGYGDPKKLEPKVIWIYEDPNTCYGEWNKRTRRLDNFLKVTFDSEGLLEYGMLETPGKAVYFKYIGANLPLAVQQDTNLSASLINRVETNVPFVRAVSNANSRRSSNEGGSSEITPSIESATQSILRKYQMAEVAAEIFAVPQRIIAGVLPESFKNADGKTTLAKANSLLGQTMVLPPVTINKGAGNATTTTPTVTQLDASNPNYLIDMVDNYRKDIAAETGIPVSMFGLASNAAPSAESLKTQEIRLVKKCSDKIEQYKQNVEMAMKIAVSMIRPEISWAELSTIKATFSDPATPTRASDVDAVCKMIESGILRADSEVTWGILNFTEQQKDMLRKEKEMMPSVNLSQIVMKMAETANEDPIVRELANRSE